MDVFPALLENDVPFYSHEIDAYWNDIGNLDELRQGNLDALRGEVAVEPGAPRGRRRRAGGEPARRRRGRAAPVLVGDGVELGEACGSRVRRSSATAAGSATAPGVRDSILLAGAELPPAAILVGGIAAPRAHEP